jgi:hypothetical protein
LNLFHPGRIEAAGGVRDKLLGGEGDPAAQPPSLRRRQGAVLDAVTLVLERRAETMRVRDVHREVEREFDEVVPFSSVNEALSSHAVGERSRFRRVRYGTYELRAQLGIFRTLQNP